jgi:hypothetical protein
MDSRLAVLVLVPALVLSGVVGSSGVAASASVPPAGSEPGVDRAVDGGAGSTPADAGAGGSAGNGAGVATRTGGVTGERGIREARGPVTGTIVGQFGSQAEDEPPEDPSEDVIGWEGGYWHNESIDVDQSDGLTDAELDAYVARAMARVEYVREREFESRVAVEVIARSEYRRQANNSTGNETFTAWNDQVWEALFVVGEDQGTDEALSSTLGASVAGFYSPVDDEIKIVTDSPGQPTIDNATLVHELVHALQDQYVNLTDPRYGGETQDEQLAADGVVEGEANYVERVYADRCASGAWDCVATPASAGGSGGSPNLGVLVTLLQPYSDGPVYVDELLERGGWTAFEERFVHPPNSTEQVIHRTDESPVNLSFEDRATDGWRPFPGQGVAGADTAGEASIYAMFWYQSRRAGADAVDPREFLEVTSKFDTYNYEATPSAGWGNDLIVPYRNGPVGDNDTEYGYVWATAWDTAADAREFESAYLSVLRARGAEARGDGRYVIPEGPFADAFYVVREGTRVTIVNGPDVTAVESIRPTGLPAATPSPTPTPSFTPTATPSPTPTPTPTATPSPTPTTVPGGAADANATASPSTRQNEGPGAVTVDGPGIVGVLLALVVTAALLVRRRRE